MPVPRRVLNGFTADDVQKITGITSAMLNYLCRHGYLEPAYRVRRPTRGKVRYFSYRDVVVTSVVQHLRETGVQLGRLKDAIRYLHNDHAWFATRSRRSKPIQWLVSDGKEVLLKHEDGFLDELRPGGQRAFAFVVSLGGMQEKIKSRIGPEKRRHFAIENRPLMFQSKRRKQVG